MGDEWSYDFGFTIDDLHIVEIDAASQARYGLARAAFTF
jgi:hypothetical protein